MNSAMLRLKLYKPMWMNRVKAVGMNSRLRTEAWGLTALTA